MPRPFAPHKRFRRSRRRARKKRAVAETALCEGKLPKGAAMGQKPGALPLGPCFVRER